MKKTIRGSVCFSFFVLLIITFYKPLIVYAGEGDICNYPEYCTVGDKINTGTHECRGRITDKVCKYSPDLDPQCSLCQEQISPTLAPVLTPTSIPTISPSLSKSTSHEQAVYNLNQGLNPSELASVTRPKDENIFTSLGNLLASAINSLLGFSIFNVPKYYAQSETIHGSYLPEEVATSSSSSANQLKGFLGGSTGFYGATLPDLGASDIKQSEELYQQAYFPEEVKPITK